MNTACRDVPKRVVGWNLGKSWFKTSTWLRRGAFICACAFHTHITYIQQEDDTYIHSGMLYYDFSWYDDAIL